MIKCSRCKSCTNIDVKNIIFVFVPIHNHSKSPYFTCTMVYAQTELWEIKYYPTRSN